MLVVHNFILQGQSEEHWIKSESPQDGKECLLRREDHRFTTSLIFPQEVEYRSVKATWLVITTI
jgi:hypothetical protein